jgi:glycosyltransferase involved in cell wall biosynthesis
MLGKIIIILPAYNEEKNLSRIIREIKTVIPEANILVIDDCSQDFTYNIAQMEGAIVLRHPFNMGYGAALQTGYKYALENGYDYLVQLDSDGQHEPKDIKKILSPVLLGEVDLVLGSRFWEKSAFRQNGMKLLGIKLFCLIYSIITGQRITDPTSGFQAMNRKLIRFYSTEVFPPDYPDVDMLLLLRRNKLNLKELPVRMYPNRELKSMHSGLKPLYYVFKMFLSILVTVLRKKEYDARDIFLPINLENEEMEPIPTQVKPIFELSPSTKVVIQT